VTAAPTNDDDDDDGGYGISFLKYLLDRKLLARRYVESSGQVNTDEVGDQ
jgi:hypothetical protein